MRLDSIFIDSDSIPSIWTVFHRKRTVFERNSIVSPFTGKNTQKKALNYWLWRLCEAKCVYILKMYLKYIFKEIKGV